MADDLTRDLAAIGRGMEALLTLDALRALRQEATPDGVVLFLQRTAKEITPCESGSAATLLLVVVSSPLPPFFLAIDCCFHSSSSQSFYSVRLNKKAFLRGL